ncbi:MBOAT family O-acyltransferase [Pseudomonas fluorescens]|nr:MBOAT family O-acyltransferase [Pseudomonas fluorescens]
MFVLFFPHLIAGPICRASQFMPQIHVKQRLDGAHCYNGLYYFIAGLALKCGIADGIAPFINVIFKAPDQYSGLDNLFAVIGFGVQILCDFWGYSLMALGAALLFGYVLPYNFNAPYSSLSIKDFWRRWHITLSNWLRDYLYIALGGSRTQAKWKIQRNLILTMLLGVVARCQLEFHYLGWDPWWRAGSQSVV